MLMTAGVPTRRMRVARMAMRVRIVRGNLTMRTMPGTGHQMESLAGAGNQPERYEQEPGYKRTAGHKSKIHLGVRAVSRPDRGQSCHTRRNESRDWQRFLAQNSAGRDRRLTSKTLAGTTSRPPSGSRGCLSWRSRAPHCRRTPSTPAVQLSRPVRRSAEPRRKEPAGH